MISLKIDKSIVESDKFLDMPKTTQLLYFMLLIDTDKDGIVKHPKTVIQANGFGADEIKLLLGKGFVETSGNANDYLKISDWKRK